MTYLSYRSRSLGPVQGDLLGDLDDVFDSPDGGDADDRDRRKLVKRELPHNF